MTTASQGSASHTAEAFADKIFRAALGTMETFNFYLGDRLGWFDALAEAAATAAELAERTHTQPRYAIEWLEMMAVYGNLTVLDDGGGNRLQRRYALPPGAAEALTNRHSLNYQVSCLLSSFAVGVVQVRASQGRRGRDTGSYVDRGERREVRAWAARTVKRLRRHDTKCPASDARRRRWAAGPTPGGVPPRRRSELGTAWRQCP